MRGFGAQVAVLAFAATVGGVVSAADAAPESEVVAERVLEALRAANVARTQNAKEDQDWRMEKARLHLVRDTVDQQIAKYESERRAAEEALAALEAKRSALAPTREKNERIEAFLRREASRIDDRLDTIQLRSAPGAIDSIHVDASDAKTAFGAALHRLEKAEDAAAKVAVELATGTLDGQTRSVEVLRFGGALAWWRSLDGGEAGTVLVRRGEVILTRARSASDVSAILIACEIAKGRRAPELVTLPIDPGAGAP